MKRLARLIAAAALAIVAMTFGVQSPAHALTSNLYIVEHATGGLVGDMGFRTAAGYDVTIPYNKYYLFNDTDKIIPRYVYAGSGYCVWEQVYAGKNADPNNFETNYVTEATYGKSKPRQRFELKGYSLGQGLQSGFQSELRIYAC